MIVPPFGATSDTEYHREEVLTLLLMGCKEVVHHPVHDKMHPIASTLIESIAMLLLHPPTNISSP